MVNSAIRLPRYRYTDIAFPKKYARLCIDPTFRVNEFQSINNSTDLTFEVREFQLMKDSHRLWKLQS